MLQTLREGAGSAFTPFFVVMSEYGMAIGPVILAFVYWCVDKRIGAWGFFNLALANLVTNVIKLTACVYRPWVLDSRLHVAPQVAATATGYSFPSGHTATAFSSNGSIAWWQRRKHTWLAVLMVASALLTGFARNWLGAHTLPDVCAAIGVSIAIMVVTSLAMRYLDVHPEKDVLFVVIMLAVCALASVYVTLKPYPMDYTPAGTLLVDPHDMTPDFWASVGLVSGWAVSWLVERRFIGFDCGGTKGRKALRFFVGVVVLGVILTLFAPIVAASSPDLGDFLECFVVVLVVGCVFPALVKVVQNRWPLRRAQNA